MPLPIHPVARKHGVSDEAMRYVVEHWPDALLIESDSPERQDISMYLGMDQAGRELEVGVIEFAEGPMILHAMRMRPRMREAFLSRSESDG